MFPNKWYNGKALDKQLLGNVNGKYALMGAVALRSARPNLNTPTPGPQVSLEPIVVSNAWTENSSTHGYCISRIKHDTRIRVLVRGGQSCVEVSLEDLDKQLLGHVNGK